MTPEQAIKLLADAIMLKLNATGQEHSILNQALNVLDKLVKEKELTK